MAANISRRALLSGLSCLPIQACAQVCATANSVKGRISTSDMPRSEYLRPLAGFELNTPIWGFGGFSGVEIDPDLNIRLISDRGMVWSAQILMDPAGQPSGIGPACHREILPGGRLDVEARVRLADGSWLISVEQPPRLLRLPPEGGSSSATEIPLPTEFKISNPNWGIEALTLLPDGRLLAIAEAACPGCPTSTRQAWFGEVRGGSIAWRPTTYEPAPGYRPTDAAPLPDRGLFVLESRFDDGDVAAAARLALVPSSRLQGSSPLRGETWLEIPRSSGVADNWEGVAVGTHAGRPLVALVSDDNNRPIRGGQPPHERPQRSLLLLYTAA